MAWKLWVSAYDPQENEHIYTGDYCANGPSIFHRLTFNQKNYKEEKNKLHIEKEVEGQSNQPFTENTIKYSQSPNWYVNVYT